MTSDLQSYSITKEIYEENKEKISEWIKKRLLTLTGEDDGMFVDYITIMLLNGKSMHDIEEDLEALIGQEKSQELTSGWVYIICRLHCE